MSIAELPSNRAPRDNNISSIGADFERTPPQDLIAEQSVLGGMLLSKDAIADVIEIKDLLLGAEQTKTPKDASGNVTIQVTIPREKLGRIFPLFIYSYQGEYQSQCCSSWELQTPKP